MEFIMTVDGQQVGRTQQVKAVGIEMVGKPLTEESFDEVVEYANASGERDYKRVKEENSRLYNRRYEGTFAISEESVKAWGESMAKIFEAEKKRQIRLEKWRQDARASLRAMRGR